MSRKDFPSRTGNNDFALSIPIDVPNPPLSFSITVASRASRAAASSNSTSASWGGSVIGRIADSWMMPVTPSSNCR